MAIKNKDIRVGFELEVMFTADGYPELIKAADEHGFYWQDNDGRAPHFLRKIIADDLSKYVNAPVSVPVRDSVHPTKKWAVKEEYDIENNAYDGVPCAVEIISPPMKKEKAQQALSQIFEFCLDKEGFTDECCGLHMSFDVDKAYRDHIPLALAMELDEKSILEDFGRSGNSYTNTQIDNIIVEVTTAIRDGNLYVYDKAFLKRSLGLGKSFAINFEKINRYGLIEFRHCGGEDVLYSEGLVCELIDDIYDVMGRLIKYIDRNRKSPSCGDVYKKIY